MRFLKRIISNKIIIYLFTRYSTYFLQFLVSLIIASRLGPFYFGIYGFICLILNYFQRFNMGIPHSLNVLLVHNKKEKRVCDEYVGNALFFYCIVGVLILIAYIIYKISGIPLKSKYDIDKYTFYIVIIAILEYFNSLYFTILRVKNKVNQLSIIQSINVILNLLIVFVLKEKTLVYGLITCQIVGLLLSMFVTIDAKVLPNIKTVNFKLCIQGQLIHKGIYLFMYNSCFVFILISVRTIISGRYSVEEFGAFTFSFTISSAVLLLLDSLSIIIFPKTIDLLSGSNLEHVSNTLDALRVAFISSSHLLIYFAMMFFPLIIYILPQYSNALTSMNLIALTILMNTNSYGYTSLLIAQNREKISASISFVSLLLNIVLSLFLVYVINVTFSYVIIATLITYLFFSFMVVWYGTKLTGGYMSLKMLQSFFPIRLAIPYCLALVIGLAQLEWLIWIPFIAFLIVNKRDVLSLKDMGMKVINTPNIIDI